MARLIRKGPCTIGTGVGFFCFFGVGFCFCVVGAQEDMTFCFEVVQICLQQRWVVMVVVVLVERSSRD